MSAPLRNLALEAAARAHRTPAHTTLLAEHTSQLAAWERDWKRLHRQSNCGNPFLSWEWQHAWCESRAARLRPLLLAECFADGSLAGLLALQRVRHRACPAIVQLEFMGQGSGGDELDCLLHPDSDAGLPARLLQAAAQRGGWHLLRLESARAGGAVAGALAPGATREAGDWLPYLPLPGSFDQMLAARSSNFRAEVRRRRRVFERKLPGAAVECASAPAEVKRGLEHLYRLHNLRRAQKHSSGIFESARLRRFHALAATRLAASAACRIYLLRTASTVIAALYGFEARGRFLYFQSGFDPAFTELSPGTVLLSGVIEDCIARGLRQFEFLRGEETYKGRWTAERRRSVNLLQGRGFIGRRFLRLRALRARIRRAPLLGAENAPPPPPAPETGEERG